MQQLVARGVPERVVDLLEAVKIDEQEREAFALAARVRERLPEALLEHGPRGQRRDGIVAREEGGRVLGLGARRERLLEPVVEYLT